MKTRRIVVNAEKYHKIVHTFLCTDNDDTDDTDDTDVADNG